MSKKFSYRIKFNDGIWLKKGCPRNHRGITYTMEKVSKPSEARVFKSYSEADKVREILISIVFGEECEIEVIPEFENPKAQLRQLRKGDCFMLYGNPYIVIRTYWSKAGPFKLKKYICKMKFDELECGFTSDVEVYRISRFLFDVLVQGEQQ